MALPTFEYDRRIDIVDALNELSTAADAEIEAFEAEAVTQAEGANAIQATIAPTESAGSKLTVSLKYGTGLAVQNGTLVATGGGTAGGVARADVIDIVKQALQSAVLTESGTLQFTLPD